MSKQLKPLTCLPHIFPCMILQLKDRVWCQSQMNSTAKKSMEERDSKIFKNIHELPFSQNSPKKLSLQRQSKVLELKFGMQVPLFWHGDEEHGDWKRGNDCWDHAVNTWTVLAIAVNEHTSSRTSTFKYFPLQMPCFRVLTQWLKCSYPQNEKMMRTRVFVVVLSVSILIRRQ